jgi:hypothetical protein
VRTFQTWSVIRSWNYDTHDPWAKLFSKATASVNGYFGVPNHRRLALHVEIKRPGEKLGDGQAEFYPRRAACWANPDTRPKTVPPHEDFLTMVVCGRDLGSDARLRFFDKVVFHDDVAQKIEVYPEI